MPAHSHTHLPPSKNRANEPVETGEHRHRGGARRAPIPEGENTEKRVLEAHSPVFEVHRRPVVECEFGVVEDGFPVSNSPLEGTGEPDERTRKTKIRTLLHPSTSICVSSIDHFFLGFFGGSDGVVGLLLLELGSVLLLVSPSDGGDRREGRRAEVTGATEGPHHFLSSGTSPSSHILLIFPLLSDTPLPVEAFPTPTVVSSRNAHAGNCLGEEGRASDTRRCCLRERGEVSVLAAGLSVGLNEVEGMKGDENEKAETVGSALGEPEIGTWDAIAGSMWGCQCDESEDVLPSYIPPIFV